MLVYVVLQREQGVAPNPTVHALLLPSTDGEWAELSVRPSTVEGCGWGVYPRSTARLDWSALCTPVLLPYLGLETVVQDAHMLKLLLRVLQGNFVPVTAGEVSSANGGVGYVRDGLCALPETALLSRKHDRLPAEAELLQVAHPSTANAFRRGLQTVDAGRGECCYLISTDVQRVLGLVGDRAHLWELLLLHGEHHHADRHLATHVAHVWRKEEGYVLINAHPGFAEFIGVTGMVNEPAANQTPTTKMIQAYALLLPPDDPRLSSRGLVQPSGAAEAWAEHTLPPIGWHGPPGSHTLSERMVLYATTRKQYCAGAELTVDYGVSYQRNYASHTHKAAPQLYPIPPEEWMAAVAGARWPQLPGWHNPDMQPSCRPAFRKGGKGGRSILVCRDDEALVVRRKQALGIEGSAPRTDLRDKRPAHQATLTAVFAKRKKAGCAYTKSP